MSSMVWFSPIYSSKAQETRQWFGTSFKGIVDYPEYKILREKYPKTITEQQRYDQILDEKILFNDHYLDFKSIPLENAPTMIYGEGLSKKTLELLPGFFNTLDSLVVTQECRELLIQFNLGEHIQFFPVSLYDLEKDELANNETYYVLNIADWRSFLAPDLCEGKLRKFQILKAGYQPYRLSAGDEFDHAIALFDDATKCDLDLWHDPALVRSLFMSNRLKLALEKAGFLENFHILATKIIHKQ
ncbi:hypothetical protein [Acinetobacter sp. HY1485]|uniref:hypothetical protein n=1 Tax=Acinetobacter sp. HY1485 TaxID=2970918 RepID=UPI0022B9D0EF|nr:hypothetical protein [Acinetobacter sp. HY1485]